MDFNLSLTTGCFVHKKNGKKKTSGKPLEMPSYKQYKKLWESMETKIKNIEENAYTETFDGLVKFVKSCNLANISNANEIPAAILVMGVNMPDHSNIFRLLEQQMHLNGVHSTVVLQSKECGTLSNLMQKLVSTIIDKYNSEMGGESVALKRIEYTFSKLLSYYEELPSIALRSPRKSRKKNANVPDLKSNPIVVCIQDVEAFSISILQEFILSCNLYVGKLPIVLVFGMASAMVTLHNILPQQALCCLGIETFYSMTAIEYLTKIVQEVILDSENPFKLGPKVFRLIVDTMLYHDFSVTNLTLLLKFCMLEHFYNNPMTTVCCNTSQIKSKLQLLQKEDLELFKELPSFARFVENNPESKTTMKNEKEFKALILSLLENQHTYHKLMIVLLNMLHNLTKDLPTSPFGKHFREVYPMALEDSITNMPCYTQAEKLLKMLSRHEWGLKLSSCLNILNEAEVNSSYLSEVKEMLQNQLEILNNMNETAETELDASVPLQNDFSAEKITSRSQLQEKLRLRLKAKRSKFDNCKDVIVQTFTTIFKELHPPSELPLYEVLYYDNISAIKRHLMVVPRITLHRNLMNPQQHLKCQCCNISNMQQVSSVMPDICSLYKLHLECGKLINLYDWLQAFKSLKENRSEMNDETELDSELDEQLKFMHSISELQLLGFIKPTKRKTDHVARLTFGSF